MHRTNTLRAIFRVAAGRRPGFGHLVRCLSLARAMGVRPLLSVDGGEAMTHAALALGGDVLAHTTTRVLRTLAPDVLVIDDPVASRARRWIRTARAAGVAVVRIHEAGTGSTSVVVETGRAGSRGRAARRAGIAVAGIIAAAAPDAAIRIAEWRGKSATPRARASNVSPDAIADVLQRRTPATDRGEVHAMPAAAPTPAAGRRVPRPGSRVVPFTTRQHRAAADVVSLVEVTRRRAFRVRRSAALPDGHDPRGAAVLPFAGRQRA